MAAALLAKRELLVCLNGNSLPFCATPKYLGVTPDRSLIHVESLRKKLNSRVSLIKHQGETRWGVGAMTLCTATPALVHSAAEYREPTWCRNYHINPIDSIINNAMRIVTGCLRPTPTEYLSVL